MTFSVTIPAYKSRFLNEAIQSVVSQTYPDWELVIVDDCSPENLQTIVKPYLTDSRIHYYRNKKNCGAVNVVDNWNICLGYCTGDYVICMGDDDRLLPYCLYEYIKMIERFPGLNVYHAKTQIINEEGHIIDFQEDRPKYETCKEMMQSQWKDNRKQYIGDFLFSRKWLNNHGGYVTFPLGYSSDWATANLAAKDKGIANGQAVTFEYRDNPNTISRTQNLRMAVVACNEAFAWYHKELGDILPAEYDSFITRHLTDMIYTDVRTSPIINTLYWLSHAERLPITKSQLIIVWLKGLCAKFWKKHE